MSSHAAFAVASEPSSATKVWLLLGSIALAAAVYSAVGRLARKQVERRLRTLMREHPEHAADLDALRELQTRRSLRNWYHDEVVAQELAPPPNLVADRRALPVLLTLVIVLMAALGIQAAVGGAIAGWIAVAALLVVAVCGLSLLAPAAGTRRRKHSSGLGRR